MGTYDTPVPSPLMGTILNRGKIMLSPAAQVY